METRSLKERLALKLLRRVSPRWKAHTELFTDPYRQWVEWCSGLGDAGQILYAIARTTKPRVIVEIGSARGYSTCLFALACVENGDGMVYAIDPHMTNDWTDRGTGGETLAFLNARLQEYGLTAHATIIRKTSIDAARDWTEPIDLLFIDGDHSLEGVKTDFELFAPFVGEHGLIAFHDSAWEHDRPWESFRGNSGYPDDMGVPEYLQRLQERGYKGLTVLPVPGLTIIHSKPGGFEFLRGRGRGRIATAASAGR